MSDAPAVLSPVAMASRMTLCASAELAFNISELEVSNIMNNADRGSSTALANNGFPLA